LPAACTVSSTDLPGSLKSAGCARRCSERRAGPERPRHPADQALAMASDPLRHAVFFPAVFLGTRRPHGHHGTLYDRNSDAALSANCSLLPITVAPESIGRGGFDPHVALRSNSRKKS
jgi:hypothetical protein